MILYKDTGIPLCNFTKNVYEGTSIFKMNGHRDNTPPWD